MHNFGSKAKTVVSSKNSRVRRSSSARKPKTETGLRRPAAPPGLWPIERRVVFLNHGSFGSCPYEVLKYQSALRLRMERQPVRFFVRELEAMMDRARGALARFIGAPEDCLAMVANATHGVNAVLQSFPLKPGDEVLVTDHEYNATRNAAEYAAGRSGARVTVAHVPFPVRDAEAIVAAILAKVSRRTRLAVIDHVTSQTGLVYPIERLAREMASRGIELLVDGAHAPGMIPLNLRKLGVTYYTGNCHKWICAPKGAAFVYVNPERRDLVRPVCISHGANSPRADRSRFLIEFGWTGTGDFSASLSIPKALEVMGGLLEGGWPAVLRRNRALALAGRAAICEALQIPLPCPDSLIGSLASIPLPDAPAGLRRKSPLFLDPLQDKLHLQTLSIKSPDLFHGPRGRGGLIRVSAQLYNSLPHYERLAEVLRKELRR